MSHNATERPRPEDERRLAEAGLTECQDDQKPNAVRWRTPDQEGGVFFSSHLPTRWGAYWRSERDTVEVVYSTELETVLIALYHAQRGALITRCLASMRPVAKGK